MAQLNIRTALEEQKRPDINIVCEKIAFQGLTRFEDRQCLPLGVSTNFTAYSAKLLTQVRCLGVSTNPSACSAKLLTLFRAPSHILSALRPDC